MSAVSTGTFDGLRAQLTSAAEAFAGDADALAGILTGIVDDVDRALAEEVEIFPVCHHSPASALAMARRLREKQPSVIYLELCEDLQPLLAELRNCRLPVALQAFASELDGFGDEVGPLSLIAPITESSAEYQAISYALTTPGVELLLVDRSSDHVFAWDARAEAREQPSHPPAAGPDPDPGAAPATGATGSPGESGAAEARALHGDAVGVELGDLRPRFAELEAHLLRHGKVRHWSEWWDQYVEQPLGGAGYDTYRQVMVLIGSLFRRLKPANGERVGIDEDRERFMWARIRQHLDASGVERSRCLYVCGAAHAASDVAEFGSAPGTPVWSIPPRTATTWLYGLIPSSHSAIEAQFGLAAGSVTVAAATWRKALARGGVTPFQLDGPKGGRAGKAGKKAGTGKARAATARRGGGVTPEAEPTTGAVVDELTAFLSRPAALDRLDEAELLGWSVEIVRLARRNGYLASTADAIVVFETAILLAGMRNRSRPTPYDFTDAAVTCIEKDTVPGRRDVRRLCEILLGGDRIGQVGYEALPPLARDVADRLAPLGLDPQRRTVQRALLDFTAQPELRPASDLLWMLRYLLPDQAVRPIMGTRRLGEQPVQESWDLAIGRHQRAIIELGYEGVTVEQVLEQRLRRAAGDPRASAATALQAVEDAWLYLRSDRIAGELGERAVELLGRERGVDDAPQVLRRIRRLLAFARSTPRGVPAWGERFVTTGFAHYCTLLPAAFVNPEATVGQVGAALGFLFGMETFALSLGCERSQLELAVAQCHPEEPAKVALLWAAQHQLGLLPVAELRDRCAALLDNPLTLPAFPRYLTGFVQALEAVPTLTPFVVEVISSAFARLPDEILLPWLPTLITTLRAHAADLVPTLVREAGRVFPAALAELDGWVPPWLAPPPATPRAVITSGPVTDLLATHPATGDALAALLGYGSGDGTSDDGDAALVRALLERHPATAAAVATALTPTG